MYKATSMTIQHLAFFIIGFCSISFLIYPSLLVKYNPESSWAVSIICVMIFICSFLYIGMSFINAGNMSFKDFIYKSLGKLLGTIYLSFFFTMLVLTLCGGCAVCSNAISTSVFVKTPTWFILLLFIAFGFYVTTVKSGNLNVFTIVLSAMILFAYIVLMILLQKYRKITYIDSVTLSTIFKNGFFKSFCLQLGALSSFGVILPFFCKVKKEKNIAKKLFFPIVIVGIMFMLSIIGGISIFGTKRFANIYYPLFIESQIVYYEGIVENADEIVLMIITLGYILKYSITVSSINTIMPKNIAMNKGLIILLTILIYFISIFLSNNTTLLFQYLEIYQYFALILFLIVPIVSCTIMNLFRK